MERELATRAKASCSNCKVRVWYAGVAKTAFNIGTPTAWERSRCWPPLLAPGGAAATLEYGPIRVQDAFSLDGGGILGSRLQPARKNKRSYAGNASLCRTRKQFTPPPVERFETSRDTRNWPTGHLSPPPALETLTQPMVVED